MAQRLKQWLDPQQLQMVPAMRGADLFDQCLETPHLLPSQTVVRLHDMAPQCREGDGLKMHRLTVLSRRFCQRLKQAYHCLNIYASSSAGFY
jgi:hypothetical protein